MHRFLTAFERTFLIASLLSITGATARSQNIPQAGIGVQVALDVTGAKIAAVAVGSPAERAGLHVGDIVVAVDNAPLHGLDLSEMTAKMRGELGSKVTLVVTGASGPGRTVQMVRTMRIPAQQQAAAPPAPAPTTASPAVAPNQAAQAAPSQSTSASASDLQFITWTEPKEHAYTVEVPRGWQIVGAVNWHSQVDVQPYVRATSPDGKVQIFLGDPDLLARQVPTPLQRAATGAREGQLFAIPTGGNGVWMRYLSGSQVAQQHLEARKLCQNPRIVTSAEHRDESAAITAALAPTARQYGSALTASAGDIGFVCDGAQGYVFAATVLASSGNNSIQIWVVFKLAGFVSTDPMQSMRARVITEHMLATMKLDPAWDKALEDNTRRITGAYISMANAAQQMQNNAARSASDDLARLNHPNAGVNVRPGSTRSSSVNTTLGTRDVCDAIGRCKTVSNDADAFFMDHSGNVVAGKAGGAPPDNSGVWSPTYSRPD